MFGWRKRRSTPTSSGEADDALDQAQQTLHRVERNIKHREPILREAAEHVAGNGIREDIARTFRVKGVA